MGIQIEDGLGRGFSAQVDSEGHLVVDALVITDIAHISDAHGQSFSWSSGSYNPGTTGDTILLVKNTSTTRNLFIIGITISSAVETRVVVHIPTTVVTTPAGTAITGTNLNSSSNNVAEAIAKRDETNNVQGNILWSGEIQATTLPYSLPLFGAVIIGQNDSIAVDYVADPTACDVTILGYFE